MSSVLSDAPSVMIATFTMTGLTERSGTTAPTAVQRWMVMGMREKLIELIGQVQDDGCDYSNCFGAWDRPDHIENSVLADHLIANGVTIPVRCKDCKHYETGRRLTPYCKCPKGLKEPWDNSFCPRGERKDDE